MSQVEELGGNRVRLTVDVSPHELEHAVEHAADRPRRLGQDPRLPQGEGAAPGAPRERRQGPALGRGGRVAHRRLVLERGRPLAPPSRGAARVRLRASVRAETEPWTFSATVEVQPTPGDRRLDDARGAARRVGRSPRSSSRRRSTRSRSSIAELVPADDRPAQEGDTLVVDLAGRGRQGPVRHRRRARLRPPRRGDRGRARRRGASATPAPCATSSPTAPRAAVEVTVKHVNEKVLPEADDELARSASEFDTIAELRADIEGRVARGGRRARSTPPSAPPPSTSSSGLERRRAPGRSSSRARASS